MTWKFYFSGPQELDTGSYVLLKSVSHKRVAKYRDATILKKVDPTQYVATVRKDLKSKVELMMEARRRSERQKKFVQSPLAEFPLQDLDSAEEGAGGDIQSRLTESTLAANAPKVMSMSQFKMRKLAAVLQHQTAVNKQRRKKELLQRLDEANLLDHYHEMKQIESDRTNKRHPAKLVDPLLQKCLV